MALWGRTHPLNRRRQNAVVGAGLGLKVALFLFSRSRAKTRGRRALFGSKNANNSTALPALL